MKQLMILISIESLLTVFVLGLVLMVSNIITLTEFLVFIILFDRVWLITLTIFLIFIIKRHK